VTQPAQGSAPTASPTPDPPSVLSGVLTVAGLAFRESARNRVLHALLASMVIAAGVSHVFAWVSGDDLERRVPVVANLCFLAINLLGVVASIFLGTNLIYQEVERRTIYTVLARPVSRGGFIAGKYLGLLGVMGVAMLAMSAAFLVALLLAGGTISGTLLLALLFTYLEVAVVIAVALFFSVAAHPIEGAVFAFVVALVGKMTESLNELAQELIRRAGADAGMVERGVEKLLYVVYLVLPNMENFNIRAEAVHGLPVSGEALALGAVYGVVYVVILLSLATIVFRRKVL
jgi:ABC-2 type transport system permease protein